jgi:hypothetical protein
LTNAEAEKVFTILSFTRDDLRHRDIPAHLIDALTDDELEAIATKLRRIYSDTDFLGAVEFFVKYHLVFQK